MLYIGVVSLCAVDWQPVKAATSLWPGRGREPTFRKGKFRHLNCLLSRSLSVLLDTAWRAKVLVQLQNKFQSLFAIKEVFTNFLDRTQIT